jgi:hypothetical protein
VCKIEIERLRRLVADSDSVLRKKDTVLSELEEKISKLESRLGETSRNFERQLATERLSKDSEIQSIISQHNAQLTELKRVHKALHSRQVNAMQQILSQLKAQQILREESGRMIEAQNCEEPTPGSAAEAAIVVDSFKSPPKHKSSTVVSEKIRNDRDTNVNAKSFPKDHKAVKSAHALDVTGGTDLGDIASTRGGMAKAISDQSFCSYDSLNSDNYSDSSSFGTTSIDDLNR